MDSAEFYINLAKRKLEICDKYAEEAPDIYRRLIAGESTFSIRRPNETGGCDQCFWAVMEAIYDKKRAEPDSDIDRILYRALTDVFETTVSPIYLRNCIDCLLYQMNSEKQKVSPFEIETAPLLEALKANIARNYDRYCSLEILENLQNYDHRIAGMCGFHILEDRG